MKIKLNEEIFKEQEKENNIRKIVMELKKKNNNNDSGFIKINNVYLVYDYKFAIDDKLYYINIGLAKGQHRGELMGFLSACVNGKYNVYDEIIDFITIWCKFDYKIIAYNNDINFIYIFNNKYKHMFDDNELE